ncbi:Crp/Fnr family transcriptional regulator [Owenweeksia hongkongensis]|uniref:Crp/Fnr family transcriptional regulator n=1 Tax=Owenweeksia hongkongensis TaxID=253245 RepID=UPI003A9029C6
MDLLSQLHQIIDQAHDAWKGELSLKRNEYLKVKGSTDTNLYYVKSGCLRVFIEDEFEEHTIRFGYEGNFIAALDSHITEKPSPFYIQALRKTELKVISKETFMQIINSKTEYLQLWQHMLAGLIYQQLEREVDILTHSPAERYKRVLERSPQLFQEVPAKYIASYLRMTPETLSRLKKS